MADYKAMYLTMFRASEAALSLLIGCCGDEAALQKAVNTLAAAQQWCGATTMHIDTDESQAANNPTQGEIYRG